MRTVALDDKYTGVEGTVLMTGTQALVRLPLLQRAADERAGLRTAGFVSGYRGSPLGGYDMEIARARAQWDAADITFQAGLNEELAATAVWGTQMLAQASRPNRDGVFAIWYGKGPGVDRSGDALKHGNLAGTHPLGGVLVCAGDDHAGKSSTVAHQSERALMNAAIPIFAPASVEDILVLGRLGFAMSRYAGVYVALKLTNEIVEQTTTVTIGNEPEISLPPTGKLPAEGIHNRPTHINRLQSEIVFKRYRWPLVERFIAANRINFPVIEAPVRRLGIVTMGKALGDVRQALRLLGLDDDMAASLGISVFKLGCVYPLEREGLRSFAANHAELLFVEEKDGLAEQQAKAILYGEDGAPPIVGKHDEKGAMLLPSDNQLEPLHIASVIVDRLRRLGPVADTLSARAALIEKRSGAALALTAPGIMRAPAFCAGCPHNRGTRVPDGSVAGGGIGCHAMAMLTQPEMLPSAQMGGEGAHWYSLARYSDVPHIFQNLGDGTYYHSGLLAIRGAVAAGANITYKILYNDAVAMTGGQTHDGPLSAAAIARQVVAEGVARCVLVTDAPQAYSGAGALPKAVTVHPREMLDAVQRELREVPGVTVVVYEQACAAEKRRRAKRGLIADPPRRLLINAAVCEGCGDCSAKSGCVSIWPRETELGRKRQIDQSSCNKDFSCKEGFCPSFVTVEGATLRKLRPMALDALSSVDVPDASVASVDEPYNVMVAGIGGTGVITIGALLAMAAHLEGKACSVMDMTGLSQKNGAVYSHVRIACHQSALAAPRLGPAEAHLMLAFDAVAALAREAAVTLDHGRTSVVVNETVAPTEAFRQNPDLAIDAGHLQRRLAGLVGEDQLSLVDATGLGTALLGDAIAANLFLLGFAAQRGLLPVSTRAIVEAIGLNGVAVPFNERAFHLGRIAASDPARLRQAAGPRVGTPKADRTLAEIVEHRTALLTGYQNAAYAERYRRLVEHVTAAEARVLPGSTALAAAVADNFAKLMAYKDEYEVGRLHSSAAFREELEATFEGRPRLTYHLAPPLLARRDPVTGEPRKMKFGSWMGITFRMLAALKWLRHTPFDPFGYTAERRMERDLIRRYEADMRAVAERLSAGNHATALELARLPSKIRGFGPVKKASVARAAALEAQLKTRFQGDPVAFPIDPADGERRSPARLRLF